MFVVCGYDFFRDENALNPSPLRNAIFKSTRLENGIFSHWYVTRDVNSPYSSEEPTLWEYLTIMDANFDGSLQAGNVGYVLDNIDGIKIKRRKVNEYDWITLAYVSAEELGTTLSFTLNDNLNQNDVEYEYAFVPVVQGIEGNYITNTIKSKFNGVFICDAESIYKFYTNVSYGTNERVQQIGVFEPFGRKYPVVVSNSLLNYETGSFKGDILNNDFLDTRRIDAKEIVEKRKQIVDFLTNKKAKILKDWNGNFWLIFITDSIQTDYANNSGMSIVNVESKWTEVGDANSGTDLYLNGILSEEQ